MKPWIIAVVIAAAGGVFFEIHRLHKAEEADRQKIQDEANRLEQLTKSLQADDKLLASQVKDDDHRKESLAKTIQDKKNQINNLQAQLSQFNDGPELTQKKAAAAAYVKKEKDKVAAIESEIKSLEGQKNGESSDVRTTQQNIDYTYHQQDANLAERINLEEQTLAQLNSQLSQIKIDKHDPTTQDNYNSQKQAVQIQRDLVNNFKQQKIDLGRQHVLAHDNVNITSRQDNSEIDTRIAILRADDTTEKKYLGQADKDYHDLMQTSDRTSAQTRDIQNKIQVLRTEIHDLELAQ